jgi:hypothetical protein
MLSKMLTRRAEIGVSSVPWTARFVGLALACLGVNSAVFAASHPPNGAAFVSAETALAKAITTLNHEPNISHTGFAGSLDRGTLDLAFSVRKAVTEHQANAIVEAYLQKARSLDAKDRHFIQPYKFEVHAYEGTLDGTLILVGVKTPGSMRIRWWTKPHHAVSWARTGRLSTWHNLLINLNGRQELLANFRDNGWRFSD